MPVPSPRNLSLMASSSVTAEIPSDDYLAEQISHGAGRAERWLARQVSLMTEVHSM